MRLIIFILLLSLSFSLSGTFHELKDKRFIDTVKSETSSDDFKAFVYNNNKFAVITQNDSINFFIISTDYSVVKGYQGTTTVGIILNQDLTVQRLNIIRSQETAAYIKRMNSMGFSNRFKGYKKGDKIEIISGATMTCNAIIQSVDECIDKFRPIAEAYLNKK